jgi:hypothetical protein
MAAGWVGGLFGFLVLARLWLQASAAQNAGTWNGQRSALAVWCMVLVHEV